MKAKSKVLLGLIVALAMVVFAVPAFAAMSFTVSAPDKAEQEVFVGDKASFSFDIADASQGADTDTYTVAVTDTAGTGVTEFATTTITPATISGKNVTVKVETPEAVDANKGEHTLKYKVTKTAGTGTGTKEESTQVAKVTVKAVPTATLTGYDTPAATDEQLKKAELKVGDAIGLNVLEVSGATYQWQIAEEKGTVTDPEDEKWEDITGATSTTLSTKATADMNGKFVRCLVTVDGKTVVAAADLDKDEYKDLDLQTVELTVADPENVTVKTDNKDATYFVGTKTAEDLKVSATGGDGNYTYQWYKDGEKLDGKTNATLTLAGTAIKDTDAGKYNCEVTDGEKVTGKLAEDITIDVKATPTLKIKEATGAAAAYADPATAPDGEGIINVAAEDMEKSLTLTAEVEELTPTWYKWYKKASTDADFAEIASAANKASYTVPAESLAGGDQYKVVVGFDKADEGLVDGINYTATIREVSGSLDGDLLTSADGTFAGASLNPDYTITLPEGEDFTQPATASTDLADYGVTITPALTGATFNVTVTEATDDAPATLTFTHTAFTNVTTPVVEPMEIVVTTKAGNTVNLPVDEKVGYKITVPVKETNLKMTAPEATVPYTGEAVEATVEAKDEGVGEISNVRYLEFATDGTPTKDDIAKATTEAPVDANETGKSYFVICDVADGEQYGGDEDLIVDKFVITQAAATPEMFVIDPETVVYDGENHTPDVTFAEGIEGAGEIEKVIFKQGTTEVTPLEVGIYDVYVNTKATEAAPCTNVAAANNLKIGTFEITKVEPTADLYTLKPTEVTYTGAEQEPAIVKADDKAGDVEAVHYYKDGSEEELEGKPVEAGVYTVKVDTKESDTYAAGKELEIGTFTIKPEKTEQPTIYINPHVENIGWAKESSELKAGESIDAGTTGQGLRVEAVAFIVPEDYKVVGFAHVQNEGDVDVKKVESSSDYDIPEGYVAYEFGSTGKGQRVEAVCIGLQDADGEYVKGFQYATHLQNYGWQGYVRNGSFSGTRGMGLRMESIRFTYADPDVVKPGEPSGSLLK